MSAANAPNSEPDSELAPTNPKPTARAEGEPSAAQEPLGPICEICGAVMYDRHCKLLCPRCGYQRDCSDP